MLLLRLNPMIQAACFEVGRGNQGQVLVPVDGGAPLTEFLLRINGDEARLRC
ncbi:hypothetical protein [Nocardia xishanensis]